MLQPSAPVHKHVRAVVQIRAHWSVAEWPLRQRKGNPMARCQRASTGFLRALSASGSLAAVRELLSSPWTALRVAARIGAAAALTPDDADVTRRLMRTLSQLDGSRDLVIELAEGWVPSLVLRVLDGRPTCRDREAL